MIVSKLASFSYQVGSVNGMQTVTREEVLDLPTAKTLQQGIHKVHLNSLDTVKPLLSGHLLNGHPY